MADQEVTDQAYALLDLAVEVRKGKRITYTEALNIVLASKQDTIEGAKAYAELYFSSKKAELAKEESEKPFDSYDRIKHDLERFKVQEQQRIWEEGQRARSMEAQQRLGGPLIGPTSDKSLWDKLKGNY